MTRFTASPDRCQPCPEEDMVDLDRPVSKDAIWAVQRGFYPTSIRLPVADVLHWAGNDVRRLRAISMALQNDVSVWYRIPGMGDVTGCRYGLEGHEYQSGFSDL